MAVDCRNGRLRAVPEAHDEVEIRFEHRPPFRRSALPGGGGSRLEVEAGRKSTARAPNDDDRNPVVDFERGKRGPGESHGRPQMVMVSPTEYERLRRQDRRVYQTDRLPEGLRAAIGKARPSRAAAKFNDEAAVD